MATRLTVAFGLLFLVTYAAAALVAYSYTRKTLATANDGALSGVAETVQERLDAGGHLSQVVDELSSVGILLEVLDMDGVPVALSPAVRRRPLPVALPRRPAESLRYQTVHYGKAEVRILRAPLFAGDEQVGYIVAATPNTEVREALSGIGGVLAVAGTVGLVLAGGGTVWLARREARPLRDLADEARSVAATGFQTSVKPEGAGSDETRALRTALAELVERQKEVLERERAFFADSSHVLRTPLAVLQSEIETIENAEDRREREAATARAHSALALITRTLSGMLLLGRPPQAEAAAWEVVEMAPLLERVTEEARAMARGLDITCAIDRGLAVAGDPHQLHDLLAAVIENACRYTPDGGKVTVSCAAIDEEDLAIEVADTGIGFSEADLASATDRFYRGTGARRMYPSGAGLGLAIAQRIARLHNGDIALLRNPGGGALVRITLPRLP